VLHLVSLGSVLFSIASAPTGIHTLSLHDALPISGNFFNNIVGLSFFKYLSGNPLAVAHVCFLYVITQIQTDQLGHQPIADVAIRSEEHTSELQSRENLVCRLLLEKRNITELDYDV